MHPKKTIQLCHHLMSNSKRKIAASTFSPLPKPRPDFTALRKPTSPISLFFWRRRIWFESTFVLSLLEPWEKLLIISILAMTCMLVLTGLFKYLPQHIIIMQRRAMYYIWGQEGDELILWQWFSPGVSTMTAHNPLPQK